MDGKNIADFIDPEIEAKLDELEREEDGEHIYKYMDVFISIIVYACIHIFMFFCVCIYLYIDIYKHMRPSWTSLSARRMVSIYIQIYSCIRV